MKAKRAEPVEKRDALQSLLMLAPPMVWALHQQLSYALTPSACEARAEWWLHALTVLAVLAVAGVTFLAWGEHRRLADESRSRFLAASGIGSGFFFLVVILATELPNWFLGACVR
jgi:cation transport ATPase